MNASTNSGEFEVYAAFENRQSNLGVFVSHLLKRTVALAAVTAVVAVVGSVANRLRYKADLKKVETDRQKALKKVARDAKKAKKSAEKEVVADKKESVVDSGITKAEGSTEAKYKWAH
jgi:uncharacterized membrane protein YcjF (UPF0283 family)